VVGVAEREPTLISSVASKSTMPFLGRHIIRPPRPRNVIVQNLGMDSVITVRITQAGLRRKEPLSQRFRHLFAYQVQFSMITKRARLSTERE